MFFFLTNDVGDLGRPGARCRRFTDGYFYASERGSAKGERMTDIGNGKEQDGFDLATTQIAL